MCLTYLIFDVSLASHLSSLFFFWLVVTAKAVSFQKKSSLYLMLRFRDISQENNLEEEQIYFLMRCNKTDLTEVLHEARIAQLQIIPSSWDEKSQFPLLVWRGCFWISSSHRQKLQFYIWKTRLDMPSILFFPPLSYVSLSLSHFFEQWCHYVDWLTTAAITDFKKWRRQQQRQRHKSMMWLVDWRK